MGRLKLLLADDDQAYIESLTGYLMEKFPYKFQVSFFTNIEILQQFLIEEESKIDIILASEKFINEIKNLKYDKETPVVIKVVDRGMPKNENTIYKYCHGEKLVQNIIKIYEKSLQTNVFDQKELQTTRVVTIYSPAGGTGKTTIAVNLSKYLAKEDFRVFYLNLESINSLNCFFEKIDEIKIQSSFSKVLFALKENDEKLNMKIKEITQYETIHNIGYFLPPDNSLELDEVSSAEIKLLLDEIKLTGLYDIVLIDLPSSFNYKNLTVMEESDEIIIITTPDWIAINKLESFLKDAQTHEKKRNIDFLGRMTLIMNRWEENIFNNQNLKVLGYNLSKIGKSIEIKLPYEEISISQSSVVNEDNNFNIELQKIVYKYCKTQDKI